MAQLTIKQAIEQGYTRYGFASKEWQTVEELHDYIFEEIEPDEHEDVVLCEKEGQYPSITRNEIADILSEYIGENDDEICARDSDEVYETVKGYDFTYLSIELNSKLKKHEYWILTDIQLIPNP